MKQIIKSLLRSYGYELCYLYDQEKNEVPGWQSMTYREAQCFRALGNMGQLSLAESRFLGDLARESDTSRPIIEIGTLFGFSTTVLTLAKHPSQDLITVDNYSWNPLGISAEAHFATTSNRLKEAAANYAVKILNMSKDEFYKTYAGPPPALFFCDADHSYEATKADILWARSVGATIICGDDYDHPFQLGTKQAVDELGGPGQLVGGLFVM